MTIKAQSNKLPNLQVLRGFAASSVVFFHAVEASLRKFTDIGEVAVFREIAWLGSFGVDVFFVISGFIMIYAHYDDFGKKGSSRKFFVKRIVRIVPNYWLLTTVATIVLIFAPQLSSYGREADIPWIIASFLFVPWTSSTGVPWPVLGLGWTLNYEMYFYVIFAIALLLQRQIATIAICVFFVFSIGLGYLTNLDVAFVIQATNWLLAEFLLGIFLGLLYKSGQRISNVAGLVALVSCFLLLAVAISFKQNDALVSIHRFFFFGTAAACLVAFTTLTPSSQNAAPPRFLMLIGDASYSLYLTHVFTLPAALLVLARLPVSLPFWVTIIALFSASVLVAVVFYSLFEKPSQKFLRRKVSTRLGGQSR